MRERIDGYRAALGEAGISIDPSLIILGGWDEENLARQLHELLSSSDRPTAFLAITSSVALVLLKVLRELGLSIPKDISIISFDDADWTDALTPPLTVVSQPIRDLATAAAQDLIARLENESSSSGEETLLHATLIKRGSVGKALTEPHWRAPIGWSGLNVSAWSAVGPCERCFPVRVDGIPGRYAA